MRARLRTLRLRKTEGVADCSHPYAVRPRAAYRRALHECHSAEHSVGAAHSEHGDGDRELDVLDAAALAAIALLVRTGLLAFRTYVGTGSAFAFFCFIYTLWFMTFNLTETRLFQLRRVDWILFVVVAVSLMRSTTPESRPLKSARV